MAVKKLSGIGAVAAIFSAVAVTADSGKAAGRRVVSGRRVADCGVTDNAGTVTVTAGMVISAVIAAVMEMTPGFNTAFVGADGICGAGCRRSAGRRVTADTGTVTVTAFMVVSAVIAAIMEMVLGYGATFKVTNRVCAGDCCRISGIGFGGEIRVCICVSVAGGAGIIIAVRNGLHRPVSMMTAVVSVRKSRKYGQRKCHHDCRSGEDHFFSEHMSIPPVYVCVAFKTVFVFRSPSDPMLLNLYSNIKKSIVQ